MPTTLLAGNAERGRRSRQRCGHPIRIGAAHAFDDEGAGDQLILAAAFHLGRVGRGLLRGRRPQLHARDAGLGGELADQLCRRPASVPWPRRRAAPRRASRSGRRRSALRSHTVRTMLRNDFMASRSTASDLPAARGRPGGEHGRAVHLVEGEEAPIAAGHQSRSAGRSESPARRPAPAGARGLYQRSKCS